MLSLQPSTAELRSGKRCQGTVRIEVEERLAAQRLTVTLLAFQLYRSPFSSRPPIRRVMYQHTVEVAGTADFYQDGFAFELPVPRAEVIQTFGRPPGLWTRLLCRLTSGSLGPLTWVLEGRLERNGKEDLVEEVPLEVELRAMSRAAA